MNKLLGAKMGITLTAFALIVSILALAALNTGGVAWFSDNRNVDANGMSVNVTEPTKFTASMTAHGINDISENELNYTADMSSAKYNLPQYDTNEIASDEYRLALLVIIEVSASEETEFILSVEADNAQATLERENFISNCIKITPVEAFTDATSVATKGAVSYVFTTVTETDDVKSCEKQKEIDIYTAIASATAQKFYFLIEYNKEFLDYINEHIFNEMINDTSGTYEPVVNYTNDLTFKVRSK